MRVATAMLVCGLLAAPALAATITTSHYSTFAEVQAVTIGGFEWVTRGDTEEVAVTPSANPGDRVAVPYDLWSSGFETAFKTVYNMPGIPVGMTIDDIQAIYETPVEIDPRTNGLLVTAFATGADRTVEVKNLKITLPSFQMYDVGDVAFAPGTDYLLIETDLPLTDGFILSGQAVFTWTGSLAPPAEQWFEVAPVVTPEPASGLLLSLGLLACHLIRRR